ncbi:MAG: hypothetical protein ABI597_04535 [Gammaproteobacteria bacterium]
MSKSKQLKRNKGTGRFLGLPHALLSHPDYLTLKPRAVKLLIDIGYQYNGRNNGDLCVAFSIMKKRGWTSNDQLTKAKKELLKTDFIRITRLGFRKRPMLYALSWLGVDECGGKLDFGAVKTLPRSLRII